MPSAITGVQDLFTIANHQAGESLFVVNPLTSAVPKTKWERRVIFIPPCLSEDLPSFSHPDTLALLRLWYKSRAVIVAACAGVFWLSNSGLLDGKQVRTHWRLCQRLSDNFPNIKSVDGREVVVDQGDIVTAAGLYAFQYLILHLIARFSGYTLAKKVSDFCLLDLNGRLQAYYNRFYPDFSHGDKLIVKAQQYCASRLRLNVSVLDISGHCHTSERTLLRRFKEATGFTPKQYILQLKVEDAKKSMEQGKISIDEISADLGYSDSSNFIKIFKSISGIPP
ncbi:GlxA family transcriptional regulator [Teredinibacter haidensis]|uniref:GlxA family transcriptional regulator n=1 Tax=Teredinibacter haidensis TaxID=2731755 RepID=UPI00094892BC|nr:helix-turn-helix domain-containing protein [Teredinibacter haidensis]